MISRLWIAAAAIAMWLPFGLVVGWAWIAFPLGVVVWVWSQDRELRDQLTRFGQALDAAANVILFNGDPRETISSHVGRMYSVKYGNAYKGLQATNPDYQIPLLAQFIKWLTDFGEPDHVYKAVERLAIETGVRL